MEAGLVGLVLHLDERAVRLLVLERAAVHGHLHRPLFAALICDGELLDEDALLAEDAVSSLVTEMESVMLVKSTLTSWSVWLAKDIVGTDEKETKN